MKHKSLRLTTLSALLASALLVSACGTTSGTTPQGDKIDTALRNAAANAAAQGGRKESLGYLEKIYQRNSADPVAATNYAAALRDADHADRAAVILAPFANDKKSMPGVKTEFAAIQLALGNNIAAEEYAQKAVLQNPKDAQAYHYLGIALDAQAKHEPAERAFRKGLEHWQGDPTTIMNNLALNLTAQGYLEEAADILLKAQAISPKRLELERNLRIVRALQQSGVLAVPKPKGKPKMAPVMDNQTSEE